MSLQRGRVLGKARFELYLERREAGLGTSQKVSRALTRQHLDGLRGERRRVALAEANRVYSRRLQSHLRERFTADQKEYRRLQDKVCKQRRHGRSVSEADLQRLGELRKKLWPDIPARDAEIIRLHLDERLSMEEIGQRMTPTLPGSTVSRIIARHRDKLGEMPRNPIKRRVKREELLHHIRHQRAIVVRGKPIRSGDSAKHARQRRGVIKLIIGEKDEPIELIISVQTLREKALSTKTVEDRRRFDKMIEELVDLGVLERHRLGYVKIAKEFLEENE